MKTMRKYAGTIRTQSRISKETINESFDFILERSIEETIQKKMEKKRKRLNLDHSVNSNLSLGADTEESIEQGKFVMMKKDKALSNLVKSLIKKTNKGPDFTYLKKAKPIQKL